MVCKLNRISKSTKHLLKLTEMFKDKGVNFVSINVQIDRAIKMYNSKQFSIADICKTNGITKQYYISILIKAMIELKIKFINKNIILIE